MHLHSGFDNQEPLHVLSITCSSSGGALQRHLRAYNDSWLWHDCSETAIVQSAVCLVPFEDEQVMLETCRDA
jgi:hypothetical protein